MEAPHSTPSVPGFLVGANLNSLQIEATAPGYPKLKGKVAFWALALTLGRPTLPQERYNNLTHCLGVRTQEVVCGLVV